MPRLNRIGRARMGKDRNPDGHHPKSRYPSEFDRIFKKVKEEDSDGA